MPRQSSEREKPIRVLIVDDHKLFAEALSMYLSRDDGVEVVGTASSGAEAIDLVLERYVDVVLMDMFMRGMDGLETTKRLLAARPETRVIVLSGLDADDIGEQIREAGADGLLQKGAAHEHVGDAIRAAYGRSARQTGV